MTAASPTEFLVEIELDVPAHLAPERLEDLRTRETARAAELAEQGVLVRLWRPDGPGWRNVGLWRASSEAELREALATLPMWPWMSVAVTPLGSHPNDPG